MIRLAEMSLFLAPLAAYALWRFALQRGMPGPSPPMLAAILVALLLFGAGLVWVSVSERAPAGSHYVPAQVKNGQIVQGHGT